MQVQHMQALQLFRRVTQFLERQTPTVAIGNIGPQVDRLKQLSDRIAAQAATQDTSVRLGKAAAAARDVNVRDLRDEVCGRSRISRRRCSPTIRSCCERWPCRGCG